jgi:hypothetical protein
MGGAHHGAGRSLNAFDLLARSSISGAVPTRPEILHDHGYLTQAIVTNPYLAMRYGFGRGFDRYENVTMESEAFVALGKSLVLRTLRALWPGLVIADTGRAVSDRAISWLARHRQQRFLLWLHYIDVHAPYGDPRALGNKSFRGDLLRPDELRTAVGGQTPNAVGATFVSIARLRAGEIRAPTPRSRTRPERELHADGSTRHRHPAAGGGLRCSPERRVRRAQLRAQAILQPE